MPAVCGKCNMEQRREDAKYCDFCATELSTAISAADYKTQKQEAEELNKVLVAKLEKFSVSTLPTVVGKSDYEILGLVFGTSSKQAFWGLSTQADRLTRAYTAALDNLKYEALELGADTAIGITFALNNSTGSGNQLLAGSSEAVMLLGTAIKFK